jgi:hypothetical protein
MNKKIKEQISMILKDLTNTENEEDEWGNEDYEYENEIEECPNGFKWCSVKQMCVPVPDEGIDLDKKLPELGGSVMDENKLMEMIDDKMKECSAQTNALMSYPDDKPAGMIKRLKKDIAGLSEIFHMLREKGEYRAFFQNVLKTKYGVDSPRELPDDKRAEFFRTINTAWKSKSEEKVEAGQHDMGVQKALGIKEIKKELEGVIGDFNRRLSEEGSYETYFQTMLTKWGVKSPTDLPEDKKKEFFDAVNSGWKSSDEVTEAKGTSSVAPRADRIEARMKGDNEGGVVPGSPSDRAKKIAAYKNQQEIWKGLPPISGAPARVIGPSK